MNEIPVYVFTGFLEAGKTTMIQAAMEDRSFNAGEKTLLLLCEEGIEEYDPTAFAVPNVRTEVVEEEAALTPAYFASLETKYGMERVLVEFNGMWQLNTFFRALPEYAMTDPFMTAALTVAVLCRYEQDPQTTADHFERIMADSSAAQDRFTVVFSRRTGFFAAVSR